MALNPQNYDYNHYKLLSDRVVIQRLQCSKLQMVFIISLNPDSILLFTLDLVI